MYEFSKSLGDSVKDARTEKHFTQAKVAEKIAVDSRTVLNIENYSANPKMEVLYPLVRVLQIDPQDIFYPELKRRNSAFRQMQILLMECSDEEIEALLPVCREVIKVMKSKNGIIIK